MREIKFRALAPDKKGNLKWFDNVITDGQEVWIETKHQGIKHLKEIKALVQYTGLKDKNGVEVYEGDIIADSLNFCYQIIYDTKEARFGAVCQGKIYDLNKHEIEIVEVIGNIYEHKHLLGSE